MHFFLLLLSSICMLKMYNISNQSGMWQHTGLIMTDSDISYNDIHKIYKVLFPVKVTFFTQKNKNKKKSQNTSIMQHTNQICAVSPSISFQNLVLKGLRQLTG